MKFIIIFFLFINLSKVFAASAVINKIYNKRYEASVIILDKTFAIPGYFFTAKFQNGNVCNLEILELSGIFALVDLRLCSMKEYLRVKQKLGSPLKADSDVDIVSVEKKDEGYTAVKDTFWFFETIPDKEIKQASIFLGYSFADSIQFKAMGPSNAAGVHNSYDGESVAEGAVMFGIDYLASKENNFGWNFNGSLEGPRNFDYVTAFGIGFNYAGPVQNSTLWLGMLALNLNFTFRPGIIPYLGINVALPVVNGGDLKLSAQFGLQGGISKTIGDRWIADLEYRFINFRGGEQLSNEVVQFTQATFLGFLVRLKYLFK
jgi:opacity protein-like surface antigen